MSLSGMGAYRVPLFLLMNWLEILPKAIVWFSHFLRSAGQGWEVFYQRYNITEMPRLLAYREAPEDERSTLNRPSAERPCLVPLPSALLSSFLAARAACLLAAAHPLRAGTQGTGLIETCLKYKHADLSDVLGGSPSGKVHEFVIRHVWPS